MKVLHLTTHLNTGGITVYIERVVAPLKRLGIETFIVSSGGTCKQDLEKAGATVFDLPIKTKNILNPKIYFAIPALKKIITENKIDILHAHTRVTQVMAAVTAKQTGIPVVTTCHGHFKRRLGRRIFPAWGDLTIAISRGVADYLVSDFKLPDDKVLTINNAVDLDELDRSYASNDPGDAKKSYGFKSGQPVVGVVARLVEDKGHEYLLRASALLTTKFPEIGILIVGDGPHRKNLEQLTQELSLQKRVVFTGNMRDITRPLAAMDIFTLPATWREGFGLSVVEAMACRKPVVVSNIWALNSWIENRVTGIFVEPKQSAQLAEAIEFLLKNPAFGEKMTTTARKMVEDNFTISRMAGELKNVYERAFAMRRQSGKLLDPV